jgi:hypothetical protein
MFEYVARPLAKGLLPCCFTSFLPVRQVLECEAKYRQHLGFWLMAAACSLQIANSPCKVGTKEVASGMAPQPILGFRVGRKGR